MLTPIPTASTCAEAWLCAAKQLINAGDECYNLVLDIDDPLTHSERDRSIIMTVDDFLRSKRAYPIATVANTIFPRRLYQQYGEDAFVQEYLKAYDSLRKKGWGRYFERMVRWPAEGGTTTDQLHDLIRRLAKQKAAAQTFRNVYEMTLFDPARDRNRNRNRQCLSFLSFKLHPERGLMLTAVYRNHHYISRALGNFIGLGHLMGYIAEGVGTKVGPLTCVSTHAEIDTASRGSGSDDSGDGCLGWRITDARELIQSLDSVALSAAAGPS